MREAFGRRATGRPLFLPAMLSLSQWTDSLLPGRRAQDLELVYTLYRLFRDENLTSGNLGSFLGMGKIILADFDDILRAGREPGQVFGEIRRWNETGFAFSDVFDEEQKEMLRRFSQTFDERNEGIRARFLELWKTLPRIFSKLEKELLEKGLFTPGLACREAARLPDLRERLGPTRKIVLVGFGQVTPAELGLVEAAGRYAEVDWIWDFGHYGDGNPFHPVNRLVSRLGRVPALQESLQRWTRKIPGTGPRIVEVHCPGLLGLTEALARMGENWGPETALILGDVGLAVPLFQSTGTFPHPPNLSAGLPLGNFRWLAWISRLLELISKDEKLWQEDARELIRQAGEGLPVNTWLAKLSQAGAGKNRFSRGELAAAIPGWSFLAARNPAGFLEKFEEFLRSLPPAGKGKELEEALKNRIIDLTIALRREWSVLNETDADWDTLRQVFSAAGPGYPLALKGGRSEGIQAMGLYESRVLDFERVVFMPAQDGFFPAHTNRDTFLPESIRRAFGIEGPAEKLEDIYFQIYRLFHKAAEVCFFYDTQSENNPSPVADQLRLYQNLPGEVWRSTAGKGYFTPAPIVFPKTAHFLSEMARFQAAEEHSRRASLSPNSLHSLHCCDLRFVFQKIMKLEESVTEEGTEMSPLDFGNWVHTTLQKLLVRYAGPGGQLDKTFFERARAAREDMAREVWESMEKKGSPHSLTSYIIEWELAAVMQERFFTGLEEKGPFRFREEEWVFPVQTFREGERLWNLSGRADLILESPEAFWILDLKTGGKPEKTLRLSSLKKQGLQAKHLTNSKDIFQILLYAWLARKSDYFSGKPVHTALWYLANPKAEWANPLEGLSEEQILGDVFPAMESVWTENLLRISDPATEIRQTENPGFCRYCSFSSICQR